MKKVVLKVEVYNEKIKKKAMRVVSGLSGVDSISMDMKDMKMTVTGDIDPDDIVSKLRKLCTADIIAVGLAKELAKEPEKKEEPKEEEPKKADDKKKEELTELWKAYHNQAYSP